MKRDLELTLPADPAGGHIAFGIMLETKSVDYEKLDHSFIDRSKDKVIYLLKSVPYEMVDHIAHDAMSVFQIEHAPFLDVAAGLHFTIERRYGIRRTQP